MQDLANSDPSSRGHTRIGISPKLSALAMAGLSVLGTIKANSDAPTPDNSPVVEVGMQPIGAGIELPGVDIAIPTGTDGVTATIKLGTGETAKTTVETSPGTPSTTVSRTTLEPGRPSRTHIDIPRAAEISRSFLETTKETAIPDIYMKWARKFSADPNVGETVNPNAIMDAANDILALQTSGTIITDAKCYGTASDEDNHSDPSNPGFGIDSPDNKRLADDRGGIVTIKLADALKGKLDGVPFTAGEGVEVQNKGLADKIFARAAARGISTMALVKKFNRGNYEGLTPEDIKVLQGLQDDRFVRCVITTVTTSEVDKITDAPIPGATVEKADPGTQSTATEIVPGVPGSNTPVAIDKNEPATVIGSDVKGHERKTHIVLIPIIIPFVGRRKGLKATGGNIDEIPAYGGDLGSDYIPLSYGTSRPLSGNVPLGNGKVGTGGFIGGFAGGEHRNGRQTGVSGSGRIIGGGRGRGTRALYVPPSRPPKEMITDIKPERLTQRPPKVIGSDRSIGVQTAGIRKMPRPHNDNQNSHVHGGKSGRSSGGDRRGRRG